MKIAEHAPERPLWHVIINHPVVMFIAGVACVVGTLVAMAQALMYFGINRKWIVSQSNPSFAQFFEFALSAFAALIGYILFVRLIERRPLTDLALRGAFKELLAGLAIGTVIMAATVGTMALFGGYQVTGFGVNEKQWYMAGVGLGPGVLEEILFRGLLFRFAEKWLGSWAAIAISGFTFGIVHITNDNATLFSSIAIALEAGILLAAVYMITRRLWAVMGLHAAWNYVQGGVFNIPVSGNEADGMIKGHTNGSELLTGGTFGAEASLPAIFLCTAAGIWALRIAHKSGKFIAPSWHRFKTGEADPLG